MGSSFSDFLASLHSNSEFQRYVSEVLLANRPELRAWAPDLQPEDWSYDSGLRAGYDQALRNLGVPIS